MSEIEKRLRRRWESRPLPLCDMCGGAGELESFSAVPWQVGPIVTCPECFGAGTFQPSFDDWVEQLPKSDQDARDWFEE